MKALAKYTIELRTLINQGYNIFEPPSYWSTFDPNHRDELCNKIIARYWFYEIGQETADRFKWNINEHLRRIIPYYNQLYQSEMLKFEPLYDTYFEQNDDIDIEINTARSRAGSSKENRLKSMAEAMKRLNDSVSSSNGSSNGTSSETWSEDDDRTVKETTDRDSTGKKDITKTGTGKDTSTGEKTTTGTGKDVTVTEEDMSDNIASQRSTTSTSNGTSTNVRRYSDTPQGLISEDGTLTIDNQYLTNYTNDSGKTTETTTGSESGTTDETRKTTGSATTDKTNNEGVTSSDTLEKTFSETDGETESSTMDETRNVTENADKSGSRNGSTTGKQTVQGEDNEKEQTFRNASDTDDIFKSSYDTENDATRHSQDGKKVTKGYTISASELLMAYRQTFINIDAMIVEELVTNFMGVF